MTIVRDNKVLLPNGNSLLLPGDEILSVVVDERREEFKSMFNASK